MFDPGGPGAAWDPARRLVWGTTACCGARRHSPMRWWQSLRAAPASAGQRPPQHVILSRIALFPCWSFIGFGRSGVLKPSVAAISTASCCLSLLTLCCWMIEQDWYPQNIITMGGSSSKNAEDEEEQAVVVTDYRKPAPDASSPVGGLAANGGGASSTASASATVGAAPPPPVDATCRAVGLENFGNTCYCNSVIQLLYSSRALRNRLLALDEKADHLMAKQLEDTVLSRFCELVTMIHKSKKKKRDTVVAPSIFVQKVKKENVIFRNAMQQDAHEFAMFVVNCLIENERAALLSKASATSSSTSTSSSTPAANAATGGTDQTPIQSIFEGTFASETSCMECESKTTRFEPFIDLSLDIEQNTSLGRCIENFSAPEFLIGAEKFRCDACCASSPARRSFRLHKAPSHAMLIHLKRFKFQEDRQMFKKLSSRVSLPNELAVHTSEGRVVFSLRGFVLHQGSGPNLGHYICCVRNSDGRWRKFDDDLVSDISERDAQQFFGIPFAADNVNTCTAYILLYERHHHA